MQKEYQELILYLEVISFELVKGNTCFYWERLLFSGCQYVNKQSQEFRSYDNIVFSADLLSEWSKNMTNIMPLRFKQSLVSFNMLRCWHGAF